MSPALTFLFGILILILFGWYFTTEFSARKRWLGLVLTILLAAYCIDAIVPPSQKIRLGLDLKGGTSFLIRLVQTRDEAITPAMLEQAVEVIRKRVDSSGLGEPLIAPQGKDSILVQIPGLDTAQIQQARDQLQRVAKLEFSIVLASGDEVARMQKGEAVLPPNTITKEYSSTYEGKKVATTVLLKKVPDMTGEHVAKAFPFFDQQGYGVSLSFDSEGAKQFDEVADQNYKRQLGILLDGEVISAPVLQVRHFGGNAQITGHFTEKEARDLASALENPLRVPVVIDETRSVSATLGEDSVWSGIFAGLTGIGLVAVFVLLYYRLAGLIALLGLAVNILILFGALAMFHFVLTLPGIAGIILTIGMAVDANVLIYERLREELASGKSLGAALAGGYDKAFSAIFDANATTLITAVILFSQATGSLRGFAITLTLGIIASMFSSLLVTRTAFRWMHERFGLTKLRMLDIIPKHKFDFLGKRWFALAISIILLGGSVVVFALRGQGNFGIDFRGGDLLIVSYQKPITELEARTALEPIGIASKTVIQQQQEGRREVLTFRCPQGDSKGILDALQKAYPDNGIRSVGEETVGAQIGMEFAKRAMLALGLGMVAILIYVTLRFEFSFAIGAVVALIHDVVITLGVFSLTGGELSLVMVGAVLTIAGYSINDTIVVYDRIREGLRNGASGSVERLMNQSINETLGRTILTGGTTLLSVAALFFFGGAVLRDFAFAILVGILVGTYSSIFVASPIVLWWSRLRGKSIRREVLESESLRA